MIDLLEVLAGVGLAIVEGADFVWPEDGRYGRTPKRQEAPVRSMLISLGLAAVVTVVGAILVLVILWHEGVV